MRVLHVISGIEPENGGPTAVLSGQGQALIATGAKVSIVATWKHQSSFQQAARLEQLGIPVTLLGPTRRPFRSHPLLNRTLEEAIARHDVVHIHAVWEAIQHRAAVLARRLSKPYVWTPHGMLDRWNMRRNGLFKRACVAAYLKRDLNAAALLHVATNFEAENLSRWRLKPPVFVQGFGLDEALLSADIARGTFRARHQLPADEPVILFLGRIQRGKGLETLVPALAAMKTKACLVVAGPDEGGYRQAIEALIARHNVQGRVHFVGMIRGEEKLQALTDADVLAAASAHENFGIAVAEAIALGTAVAVSDQVGLADAIAANNLGQVSSLTIPDTAAALDAALVPDATRRQRARAYAQTHFRWPAIAENWVRQYESVLGPAIC